ncbi:hypothetical protein [Bradyrhizobium forestalis]|uniref:hypothetical protein n=1 Tax=Bradyrhizobium forestalis TaxID=1419263 RepID=UPI00142DE96D|nr:hypothetical protein [Bradyrhizobium forestalis]
MKDLRDWSLVQAEVIELQGTILEAPSGLFAANEERAALIEKVRELEERLAAAEAWETKKLRYKMVDVGGGARAYMPKAEMSGGEPPHYICANYFQQGKISVLDHYSMHAGHVLKCPTCEAHNLIKSGQYRPPRAPTPLVACHSDFDRLGQSVRLAPAESWDQRGVRYCELSLATF